MRKILALLFFCSAALAAVAQTVNVTYNVADFTTAPVTGRRIVLTPLSAFATYSGSLLSAQPLTGVTGTNGSYTFSNIVSGYTYQLEVDTPYSRLYWTNGFPSGLSGNVNGKAYLGVQVTPQLFAWNYVGTNFPGTVGQVLTTDGTNIFWATGTGGGTTNNFIAYTNTAQAFSGVQVLTNSGNIINASGGLTNATGAAANSLAVSDANGKFSWTATPTVSGANITSLNAGNLSTGTVPQAQLPTTMNAANLGGATLNATNLGGTVASAALGNALLLVNTNSLAQDPTNGLRANLVGTYLNLANTNKLAQDLTNGVTAWAVTTNDARALTLSGTLNLGTANGLTVVNASNVVAGNIQSPALISSLVGADGSGNLMGATAVLPLTYNSGGQTISLNAANLASAGSMSAADYQTMRTNIARLNGTNAFSGTNNFTGIVDFTGAYVYFTDNLDIGNGDNIYLTNGVYYGFGSGSFVAGATGGFTGNGANLTNLNATQLTSGTVPAAALGNAWQTAAVNVSTGNSNYLTRFDYTGPTPTIQTNGGNGIGGSAQISGTDGRGFITLTTGTALVASTNFYTVTFSRPYNNVPTVIVTSFATNAGASWSAANQVLIAQHCSTGATTTGFFLMGDTTIFAASKNIYMQYQVTGD